MQKRRGTGTEGGREGGRENDKGQRRQTNLRHYVIKYTHIICCC